MGFEFKKTPMSEREFMEVSSLIFVQLAQNGTFDNVTIAEHPSMFPTWTEKWTGKAGTILMDEGRLYKSIHTITSVAQNTKPSKTPSMWTAISDPTVEYPQWVQPIGAHDAYLINSKVSYNGKKWKSIVNNNVWQPGVYGWEEVV